MEDNQSVKDCAFFGIIFLCAAWQVGVAILGVLFYFICRGIKIHTYVLALIGVTLMLFGWVLVDLYKEVKFMQFLLEGFRENWIFLRLLTKYNLQLALYYLLKFSWSYLIAFPVLIAAILQGMSELFSSVHAKELKRMSRGKHAAPVKINQRLVSKELEKLKDENYEGTLLGISLQTYRPLIVPDYYVNQIVLVLGTTGSGKTITLDRFSKRPISRGYPLLFVDGKPSRDHVNDLWQLAKNYDRPFFGLNCGNSAYYNYLSGNSYTELKDKIITLKDQWESDYYRTVAEDYLQTTLEVLIKTGQRVDLKAIAQCLDFDNLALLVKKSKNQYLMDKIKSLQKYDRQALTGLQAHLNLLINSELGEYLLYHPEAFTLKQVIEQKGVAYFALPALKFPSFAKVLGKLIINDIKSAIEPLENNQPIFIIFDEFSVFAGEQVLNLVNMGRSKGVHAIFGTQGLADLKKVDDNFESQLLNCVNTVICHRLNHQESAESVSKWIGTHDSYDVTAVVNLKVSPSNLGSLSKNKAFIVHPDEIKQSLNTGEAYFATKAGKFIVDKLKVKM